MEVLRQWLVLCAAARRQRQAGRGSELRRRRRDIEVSTRGRLSRRLSFRPSGDCRVTPPSRDSPSQPSRRRPAVTSRHTAEADSHSAGSRYP